MHVLYTLAVCTGQCCRIVCDKIKTESILFVCYFSSSHCIISLRNINNVNLHKVYSCSSLPALTCTTDAATESVAEQPRRRGSQHKVISVDRQRRYPMRIEKTSDARHFNQSASSVGGGSVKRRAILIQFTKAKLPVTCELKDEQTPTDFKRHD